MNVKNAMRIAALGGTAYCDCKMFAIGPARCRCWHDIGLGRNRSCPLHGEPEYLHQFRILFNQRIETQYVSLVDAESSLRMRLAAPPHFCDDFL